MSTGTTPQRQSKPHSATGSDLDTDDSWSVIYSDDSNSINDADSKLTDSTHGDDDTTDQVHQIPLLRSRPTSFNNDSSSVMTLKDSNQWNGALSIPKLSVNQLPPAANLAESSIELKDMTPRQPLSSPETELAQDKPRSKLFARQISTFFNNFIDFIDFTRDKKTQWIKKFPQVQEVGNLKNLVALLSILGLVSFHLLNNHLQRDDEILLESLYPSYNVQTAMRTNYLMCDNSKNIVIIERSPSGQSIERISYYGNSPEPVVEEIGLDIKRLDKVLPRGLKMNLNFNTEVQAFATKFCGAKIDYFIEKTSPNDHEGNLVIFSDKHYIQKSSGKLLNQYPVVRLKEIRNFRGYSQPDSVLNFANNDDRTINWDSVKSVVDSIQQKSYKLLLQLDDRYQKLSKVLVDKSAVLNSWKQKTLRVGDKISEFVVTDISPIVRRSSFVLKDFSLKVRDDLLYNLDKGLRFYETQALPVLKQKSVETVFLLRKASLKAKQESVVLWNYGCNLLETRGKPMLAGLTVKSNKLLSRGTEILSTEVEKALKLALNIWQQEGPYFVTKLSEGFHNLKETLV